MSVTAFLTDSTLCIGCKACEVACKEWNGIAEDGLEWSGLSYDNTLALGAATWRHVKFVEQPPIAGMGGNAAEASWTFSSDVCNGCGYCVTSCPFGVVERNKKDGRAFKCTFCYDRQKEGLIPACAKACPTESIKFGDIETLRETARDRVEELHRRGLEDATIYDPQETSVAGTHAMFIVRGDPRTYNLPPAPEVPTVYLKKAWTSSAIGAGLLLGGTLLAFLGDGGRKRKRLRR